LTGGKAPIPLSKNHHTRSPYGGKNVDLPLETGREKTRNVSFLQGGRREKSWCLILGEAIGERNKSKKKKKEGHFFGRKRSTP